ncbi:MAG TPA: VWA domain-containing protein [Vicinamibacterales bacterium]|nr:VWA domain-containing protein [Vicinamibacterales bacterium]
MRFGAPSFLPLLALPIALLLLWFWQLWRRRADARAFLKRRQVPVDERIPFFGELLFWFFLILAAGSAIVSLARPQAVTSLVRTAGVDLVILQDGSASMHVTDVRGNRWQRSMQFLRTLGESLRWDNDRVAMALFAHMATPQIRLTRDPNTYFFFLDHLADRSPYRLEDDGTWDTNIERGIYWGMRLIEKDEELRRTAPIANLPEANNAKAFVLISDGQSWSGEVAKSLALAQGRGIPVNVVGIGTTAGGIIPDPKREPNQPAIRSVLNRAELTRIATAGGGRYYELDRETDREIANAIIDSTRRRAGTTGVQEGTRDLYWNFLLAAGAFLVIGVLFLRDRTALALQLAAASAVLIFVQSLF